MDRYTDADSIRRRYGFALPAAAQRLKCCAYSLMIFASSASPAFPRRAQTSPRGGNAAHRAAYRPTPALLRRARPRISGRNKIPEKHRRVFAADSRFRNRFPCGAKPAAGFGCGKSRSGAQHFPAPTQTAARRWAYADVRPPCASVSRRRSPAFCARRTKNADARKTNAFFGEHS